MNKKTLLRAALLTPFALVGVLAISSGLSTQDEGAPMGEQPAKEHGFLKKLEGEWTAELKMFMAPGAPPMTMSGAESVKMLGEFWAVSDFSGEFMGYPFQGIGTTGYDPKKEVFIGTWIDSSSSFLSSMEGTIGDDGVMTFEFEAPDMTGAMAKQRSVGEFIDDNNRTYKNYVIDADGEANMTMEITYTREK